ncbi:MAG: hypothetical protein CMH62_03690 [Nanoarchaeota archaeon]|nr:hypothetical protein [Nanoarchaeota archaeon]
MLQMLKAFSKQGRLLEILLHGKNEVKLNGYAVNFHWDDLDDYVTIYNVETNRRKRILINKIKKIIAKGEYNNEFKT